MFHSKLQNKCSTSIWYKYLYSLFSLLTESSIICGCVWTIGHILWLFISSFNTTHIIHYNSIKFSVWRMDTYKQFCCFFIHLSEYCQQFILIYLVHAISDWLEGISPSQCEKMCLNFTLVLIWRVSQKNHLLHFFLRVNNTVPTVLWWEGEEGR